MSFASMVSQLHTENGIKKYYHLVSVSLLACENLSDNYYDLTIRMRENSSANRRDRLMRVSFSSDARSSNRSFSLQKGGTHKKHYPPLYTMYISCTGPHKPFSLSLALVIGKSEVVVVSAGAKMLSTL